MLTSHPTGMTKLCKVENSQGINCSHYPTNRQNHPIAFESSITRCYDSPNTNLMQQRYILNVRDILWPLIWWWSTYLRDGTKRVHLGRLVEILPPAFQPCLEIYHPSTPTRNDVRDYFCCHVSSQFIGTILTSKYSMDHLFWIISTY